MAARTPRRQCRRSSNWASPRLPGACTKNLYWSVLKPQYIPIRKVCIQYNHAVFACIGLYWSVFVCICLYCILLEACIGLYCIFNTSLYSSVLKPQYIPIRKVCIQYNHAVFACIGLYWSVFVCIGLYFCLIYVCISLYWCLQYKLNTEFRYLIQTQYRRIIQTQYKPIQRDCIGLYSRSNTD